ncbi:MAG: Smr/MutS family protein [Alistipes sp.]|jgi:DNA mismatch repair protein MutS2|nr:Smr/MutS family protein [Alistipes sp.]
MIYPENFEAKTGFDVIRRQVAELCTTAAAREMVDEERFTTSSGDLARRLGLADELRLIMVTEGGFPGGEFVDTAQLVAKARLEGAFLEVDELRTLHRALAAVGEVVGFVAAREAKQYPLLRALSDGIESFPAIVGHIDSLVDRHGGLRDSASSELFDIRRTIRAREGDVAKRMQRILAQAQSAGIVDADASLSIRDGRTVIPVAAGNKKKLPGFIHDESASGRTFYIEPVEIVEINNELKELEYAERRETVRILTTFTESLRPDLDGIAAAGVYLCEIDFIRAKARWAAANDAVRPIITDDGRLVLRQARHPLLAQTLRREKKELVPLDIALSPGERIIVISGPNAGGKSVCLKTVALLQYMFQCGFLVPALENSEMPVFESLLIDIGDEQSIESDLSTYSSHLLNMKQMVRAAGPRVMVFIDEFGSGTEPVIGGAIAESVLERFVERGVYGVVTTHYSNIKYFASNHEGVANGAMAFDVAAIRPLFRLIQGEPGSSFAVEIARKIGLPEEIIHSAADKAGSDHIDLERQLREIARDRRYWETKREKIRLADRRVEALEADYATRLAAIKAERSEIMRTAKAEARALVTEANKQIENTIKVIRESQAEKELTRLARREVDEFRESLDAPALNADGGLGGFESDTRFDAEMERIMRRQANREKRKAERARPATPQVAGAQTPLHANEGRRSKGGGVADSVAKKPLGPGAKVRLKGQDTVGEIHEVKGAKASVAFGQILSTVALDRLEAISAGEFKTATRPTAPRTRVDNSISERRLQFSPRVDVRGLRPGEAIEAVEDFIDNALMIGVNEVSILHGKGTGALKSEIRRYLRTIPAVASATDDHADRGGAGITIVTFKQ